MQGNGRERIGCVGGHAIRQRSHESAACQATRVRRRRSQVSNPVVAASHRRRCARNASMVERITVAKKAAPERLATGGRNRVARATSTLRVTKARRQYCCCRKCRGRKPWRGLVARGSARLSLKLLQKAHHVFGQRLICDAHRSTQPCADLLADRLTMFGCDALAEVGHGERSLNRLRGAFEA